MMKKILYVLTLFTLVLLIYFVYDYASYVSDREQTSINKGTETTNALVNKIESALTRIMFEAKEQGETLEIFYLWWRRVIYMFN